MRIVKIIIALIVVLACWGLSNPACSQQSQIFIQNPEYGKAIELFDKEKYSAAQKMFRQAIKNENNFKSEISINSEYYAALCALELFNKDAEFMFREFIENHPESPKVKVAYFQLGRYNYRKKNWDKVIDWFEKVNVYDLNNDEVPEYYFKLGYAYYMEKKNEKASNAFYEIKDVDTKYTAPALYYFSHIAYNTKNYETALQGFNRLKNNEKFAPVVPYYITQIYYLQEKYDDLLKYAPGLLDSADTKRQPEIARLIGDAYYRTNKYKEAIPFLERYHKQGSRHTRDDDYQLAYAYYKSEEFDKAIERFKYLADYGSDTISQISFYHLGDCYLKTGKKNYARTAYYSAYKMELDKQIQEDALFNYAKLAFETSYDPYFKAADAIWEYIDKYPDSPRRDEALTYLVSIYMTSKNYKAAMISLEAIKNPDERLKTAHQLIAYNLGVDNLLSGYYKPAIANFKKVHIYPVNSNLSTLSHYWTAEAYYLLKDYNNAIENYKIFMYQPRAILHKEFNEAQYNIAYSHFKKEEYLQAASWFRKYTITKDSVPENKLHDAFLRTGDCYFVSTDYNNAIDFYNEALKYKGTDRDYAQYQKAITLGLLKKNDEKIQTLEELIAENKTSSFSVDAKYQLAQTYMFKSSVDKALYHFNDVVNNYPNSSYVKKSMLGIGQLHFNSAQYDKALDAYKKLVISYPNYEDAGIALDQIKRIYTKTDNIDEFENWLAQAGITDYSNAALDSANYDAAYIKYTEGDCDKAIAGFKKYFEKFSRGIFLTPAHFYKADCEYRKKDFDNALESYNYVLNQPLSKFSEAASLNAAKINYDKKNYPAALNNYITLEKIAEYKNNLLESRIGQMRCFYKLRNYDAAIDYANKVLASEKVSENIKAETHLIGAKSAMELDNLSLAFEQFNFVVKSAKNEMTAEAQYNIAFILYVQENYTEAEKTIFELVNQVPAYDYWIAKGLILLADVYVVTGDNFQAKHTLQSIIENYQGAGLVNIAREKLKIIEESEKTQKEVKKKEEIKISFDDMDKKMEELFEEEKVIDDLPEGSDL